MKWVWTNVLVGGGLIVALGIFLYSTQLKLGIFEVQISDKLNDLTTKVDGKIKELDTVKSQLKEANQQLTAVTKRVDSIPGVPAVTIKPIINLSQKFITFGEEQGKGDMIRIPKNGGSVFQEEIANCQNCTSASYSFSAARYAQSNLDKASVAIYVHTNQGRYEATHNLTTLIRNSSEMNTGNMESLTGQISFQGQPTRVELYVIPGDWAVEIQDFRLQFE